MITFFIAFAVLILGYFVYGKFVEKLFGADPQRATPATTMADGVDYVPMKPWRIFLIQFHARIRSSIPMTVFLA